MNEQEQQEDMKEELNERHLDENFNKAERIRKAGLRTQPKPGDFNYKDSNETNIYPPKENEIKDKLD